MITKIFYSLVLFPNIKYSDLLKSGYYLDFIEEQDFGIFKLFFKNNFGNKEIIFFKHKLLLKKKENNILYNWGVYGNNDILLKDIVNLLIEEDKKKDFNFFDNKLLNRERPFGVVLTITSKCNIFCYYCFNDIDYDLKYRNIRKNKGINYWKKVIDKLYNSGTRVIILTGGEPMIAPFFWELLDYLKNKNIFIHLNTNGTLLNDENLNRLNNNYSVNIMVSMHEFNDIDYYKVNKKGLEMTFGIDKVPQSFKVMFSTKVKQLRKINNLRNISLEFLTILNIKNILNLEKIYNFGLKETSINIHNWQFFRLYATKNNKGISKLMMKIAIEKMYKLNSKYNIDFKIVDPVPFCVIKDLNKASKVIDGVLSDTHDVKTIITTDGNIQLMSAYDNNFWNIDKDNIKDIFLKSDFVNKMLNNGFLPKDCYDCKYKEECRGGSRMDANIINGSYSGFDPIGDINNKINI